MQFTITSSVHAFGDGTHPTTAGVMAALEAMEPGEFVPRAVCDMGCGSGILSLAMAAMFSCPIVAVDMAAESVAAVRANAQANGVGARIRALQADGFAHPAIHAAAPFDLIVMNILAEPLMALAADAEAALAAGGVLIISGLLQWQETQIRAAYQALGLELATRLAIGDWVTLVWQKPEAE